VVEMITMPKVAEGIFTQYYDSAMKLAARETGVSRPELMKELGVGRVLADKLIEEAGLRPTTKVGRTEFFKLPDDAPPVTVSASTPDPVSVTASSALTLPEGALAAVIVNESAPAAPLKKPVKEKDDVGEEIQSLNKQIVEVKKLIASDFAEMAKTQARLTGHQALLTALLLQNLSG
jgi:hypothetical protein